MDILKLLQNLYPMLVNSGFGFVDEAKEVKQAIEYIEKQEPLKFTINNDPTVHTMYLVPPLKLRELSDAEMSEIWDANCAGSREWVDIKIFARAIIAAAQERK